VGDEGRVFFDLPGLSGAAVGDRRERGRERREVVCVLNLEWTWNIRGWCC
jgi:hypothetical protein